MLVETCSLLGIQRDLVTGKDLPPLLMAFSGTCENTLWRLQAQHTWQLLVFEN